MGVLRTAGTEHAVHAERPRQPERRSDIVDGFTLDRGFQVALTAYPEMHRQLDMDALDLQAFDPGALIWRDGSGSEVSDPFRKPSAVLSTTFAPIGNVLDKARIAWLRTSLRRVHPVKLLQREDVTTQQALEASGFSDTMIRRFFRPLVGGIQLDPDLQDSRRMFDVIFRMLSDGDSAVPAAGMQAIPDQLAAALPDDTVRFDARVESATATSVRIGGVDVDASAVVIATEGPAAAELLVDSVRRAAPELASAGHAVDAYGGVGLFAATVMSEARHVTLVESARSSCFDARENLAHRSGSGPKSTEIVRSDMDRWSPDAAHGAVDVMVADPARPGLAKPGVAAVVRADPAVLVLVSCDPVSLARDARTTLEAAQSMLDAIESTD